MQVKVDGWPVVVQDDDGIRPAGDPGRCFYCNSGVGELHGARCVCVEKLVSYNVLSSRVKVGTFQRMEPHFWSSYDCEFHKNESSWCSDNALGGIQWLDTPFARKVREFVGSLPDDQCSCATLEFRFMDVVDDGPFVERSKEVTSG